MTSFSFFKMKMKKKEEAVIDLALTTLGGKQQQQRRLYKMEKRQDAGRKTISTWKRKNNHQSDSIQIN